MRLTLSMTYMKACSSRFSCQQHSTTTATRTSVGQRQLQVTGSLGDQMIHKPMDVLQPNLKMGACASLLRSHFRPKGTNPCRLPAGTRLIGRTLSFLAFWLTFRMSVTTYSYSISRSALSCAARPSPSMNVSTAATDEWLFQAQAGSTIWCLTSRVPEAPPPLLPRPVQPVFPPPPPPLAFPLLISQNMT